ncbi:hypothetical protein A1O3_02413 [Capronia epimyces CBS 606.96]|uniref:Karyogamy protein n=1 Tax=Capronia epimyces CBS 606.96 TaxID=1182542 RepID=W9YJF1_9EURO|nr:uncharacterized protein A1O3_02413 [Capronia epimyces CBS 606.96]EXJ89346.1 hypothetical protein A1O3_02413 [Capronia epimyces CBS 606.96]
MVETQSDFDFHQLLVPTPTNDGPPPRHSSSASSGPSSDAGSFMIPDSLSRSNSAYSFSRASFSSQLASLTGINLPQAESLAATVTSLPTARKAVKTLMSAAEQIQAWNKKALRVLESLDADDDVEWAAAAGRLGLDETDKTIRRFETLINVYILSIEKLQCRPDIGTVKAEELQAVVEQMEVTLEGWDNVRKDLKKVHQQVELAMEWEELWAKVLGDVGAEMDNLSQLVFEMEEKRHAAYQAPTPAGPSQAIDLNELESFIDEPSEKRTAPNSRFSLPPFESSPLGSPIIENPQDDSNLLALFARMQPLRASLDFLPMRLSMFQSRAEKIFPIACQELDEKRTRLEKNWTELSKEAENLRRELSEDRWVIVFRNAGRQAQKMCESVERSILKVQEAITEDYRVTNPAALAKRIESFEAKRMHYGPAINRVLGIIQKGLKDRLTVNGEILRLHKDLSSRMRDLTDTMEDLESLLEPYSTHQNSKLRESISSIVSADRSLTSTTFAGTPGSSPPSSVDLPPHRMDKSTPKYGLKGYTKQRTPSSSRPPPLTSSNRRGSIIPQSRRPTTPMSHASGSAIRRGVSPLPGPPSVYRQGVYSPPVVSAPPRPSPTPVPSKPRWSAVVKSADVPLAPTYRSSSATKPPTARKYTPRSISSSTALPLRSPLSREATSSPSSMLPTLSKRESQQFRSFAERVADPSPARTSRLMDPVPYHRGRNSSAPAVGTIRSPSSVAVHSHNKPTMSGTTIPRPPSSLNRNHGPSTGQRLRPVGHQPRLESRLGQSEADSEELDRMSDHEDDEMTEPNSSPLSKRTITRPSSVLAMANGKGKRMSLLPVPVGSGRQSSLGSRMS